MSISEEDLITLVSNLTDEWKLSTIPNIETLLTQSTKLADSILLQKYQPIYTSKIVGTSTQQILFCSFRKLIAISLFFKANPQFLDEYIRSQNIVSISNPDAGSITYRGQTEGNKTDFLNNLYISISRLAKNLGIKTNASYVLSLASNALV